MVSIMNSYCPLFLKSRLCAMTAMLMASTIMAAPIASAQTADDGMLAPHSPPSSMTDDAMKESDSMKGDAMKGEKSMTSNFTLPDDDGNHLGIFAKGGFAFIITSNETGFFRGRVDERTSNSFKVAYAPTFAFGYDFNRNYSAEVNFLFYEQSSLMSFDADSDAAPRTHKINNFIFTVDQSYHGLSFWRFAVPLRLGVGALLWSGNSLEDPSGNFFLLKLGSGLKYNITEKLWIFSTMDVETRFDYYFLFGDRRNTNVNQGSELLLAKDLGSGSVGSVMVDFKLGF